MLYACFTSVNRKRITEKSSGLKFGGELADDFQPFHAIYTKPWLVTSSICIGIEVSNREAPAQIVTKVESPDQKHQHYLGAC